MTTLEPEQKTTIIQKATSFSRIMALLVVIKSSFVSIWMTVVHGEVVPMPWQDLIGATVLYAVGQHTKYVLDFIRDIVPWAKTKADANN
jgi:hypothetical protein